MWSLGRVKDEVIQQENKANRAAVYLNKTITPTMTYTVKIMADTKIIGDSKNKDLKAHNNERTKLEQTKKAWKLEQDMGMSNRMK